MKGNAEVCRCCINKFGNIQKDGYRSPTRQELRLRLSTHNERLGRLNTVLHTSNDCESCHVPRKSFQWQPTCQSRYSACCVHIKVTNLQEPQIAAAAVQLCPMELPEWKKIDAVKHCPLKKPLCVMDERPFAQLLL